MEPFGNDNILYCRQLLLLEYSSTIRIECSFALFSLSVISDQTVTSATSSHFCRNLDRQKKIDGEEMGKSCPYRKIGEFDAQLSGSHNGDNIIDEGTNNLANNLRKQRSDPAGWMVKKTILTYRTRIRFLTRINPYMLLQTGNRVELFCMPYKSIASHQYESAWEGTIASPTPIKRKLKNNEINEVVIIIKEGQSS
ncbi:hypothetical protein DINM_006129 [Dirofilaria immitis]|nr:hypothetical protein [Dirofilaria immitis]